MNPRAQSVGEDGQADGWEIPLGFRVELERDGETRMVVSVPAAFLETVHLDLVRGLEPPLSVLYRQVIDRANPKPEGAPQRDFVALQLSQDAVTQALTSARALVYGDARAEFWIRGSLGESVVLDADGLIFVYPDDPLFRDVCLGHGLPAQLPQTIAERDYVKHWFHADNDALEAGFLQELELTEVPPQTR